jgi:hypothetical protein
LSTCNCPVAITRRNTIVLHFTNAEKLWQQRAIKQPALMDITNLMMHASRGVTELSDAIGLSKLTKLTGKGVNQINR